MELFIPERIRKEGTMAKVIILCGRIASGKSYYANKLKEQNKAVILSVDELMLRLSDSCLGQQHDDTARRCEAYFYQLAEQMIGSGINVIIDYGYWSKKDRQDAKDYFRKKGMEAELHYLHIPEELRLKQLENRNERLIAESKKKDTGRVYIIDELLRQRLDAKFEEPSPEEVDELITNT